MIKKGQEIKSEDGEILAIANRDLYVGQTRKPDDFILADGSMPIAGTEIPYALIAALTKTEMGPVG